MLFSLKLLQRYSPYLPKNVSVKFSDTMGGNLLSLILLILLFLSGNLANMNYLCSLFPSNNSIAKVAVLPDDSYRMQGLQDGNETN